jgi:hypothetical protein
MDDFLGSPAVNHGPAVVAPPWRGTLLLQDPYQHWVSERFTLPQAPDAFINNPGYYQ